MDFWVNEKSNTHKQSNLSNSIPSIRPLDDKPSSRVFSALRRSRADTMPSQPAAVFPSDMFSDIIHRHRSGSITLPADKEDEDNKDDLSSPIDENASSTIASTLASLGLTDDENTATATTTTTTVTTNNRNRSYTIQGAATNEAFGFHPFSPQTQSSILQRPRAISLGMADSFSPFQHEQQQSSKLHIEQKHSPILRSSRSTNNLLDTTHYFSNENIMDNEGKEDSGDSPSSSQAQIPSRALWLGNINPSVSVPDLVHMFSAYGPVESARILSDKECAFVNFLTVDSAVAAKNDLETRLGSKLAGTPVRVGFGKADVSSAMADASPNTQGPTRALWVGNIPTNASANALRNIFQAFGSIESVRILSHKNCGFINFERQEDAVHARKALQNKEIFGPGTGTVRIGFAKAPSASDGVDLDDGLPVTDSYQAAQWATAVMMANMMMNASGQPPTAQPSLFVAIASERLFIMKQLGIEPSEKLKVDRIPLVYHSAIPPVPELGPDRKLDPLSLREMRKKLENEESVALEQAESIASDCMDEVVELCSDYIGNTVIQKLFECCTEETKLKMLKKIAPHLASIGIHKNGTWAAQKIVDFVNEPEQIQLIKEYIAPYIPLLLLDQYGNYVVQCCLVKKDNQYIFDAIVDKCWEIGQGRFGARAVRSILDNPTITQEQRVYVAASIVQNATLLTTNANGSLLLNWFLDSSQLPGRYRVLCPRLLPYLSKLCINKLGSITIQRIIQQSEEPDAATLIMNSLSEKARSDLLTRK
ncbi:ARM repeat-containing protein [Rhizopus microsporus var. microsporus]|uniref:ARM repeat-containing protein n=2 Tax=Rhizopus microsporus TaxID=58291 RepID=A0A2G4SS66_RHIZD|nr:ARM repeat-containing protein [Rhizopus microsporus ATCC 52813]ORE08005.1 ARM repeat-containing protein [Rhizopus microsporus var. microsporus]PHZ11604.1 ARM repeat-containing protein [Rhizopus microsporus ATCC 52813]